MSLAGFNPMVDSAELVESPFSYRNSSALNITRILRTVAYLKPEQVFWQIVRRAQGRFESPKWLLGRDLSAQQWALRDSVPNFGESPVPQQSRSRLLGGEFTFLNATLRTEFDHRWDVPGASKLWLYNLHYFDWLWSFVGSIEEDWSFVQAWVQDWIDRHPAARRATGWEPYPTSLRLINWTLLFFSVWREKTLCDREFQQSIGCSMGLQLSWLQRHLEYHIQANHLLENAVALAVCGKAFGGELGERAFILGNRLCRQQLKEQILSDGMHYERSAMYHCRVLWLTQLICVWGDDETIALARGLLPGMQRAMDCMEHGAGWISQFNDSANRIYVRPASQMPDDATTPRSCETWSLPAAGFYGAKYFGGLNSDSYDSVICNCGTMSPSYQPGHAHADSLSFEWFVAGEPVITDTGVYEYLVSEARQHDRSTRAHNTLEINRRNSSDVWSSFRVGKRADVRVLQWEPSEDGFFLKAEQDGYAPVMHQRSFRYDRRYLLVEDHLSHFNGSTATSFLHFSPHCVLKPEAGNWKILERQSGITISIRFTGDIDHIESTLSPYSPEFGIRIQRPSLAIRISPGKTAAYSMHFEVTP